MRSVDRDRALDVATAAFEANGVGHQSARLTAEVLVSADARHKHSHGLLRLPRYVNGLEHGNVDPDGEVTTVKDNGVTAVLHGGSRLGPVVASEATAAAMARAETHSIAAVAVQAGNHLGMLGYYTDQLRQEGFVGLAITNTEPAMPPHGGTEPTLGTNPIAIGLPTDPPFNLDMSTAAIARGDVVHHRDNDEPLPEGVALDEDGQPTTDPESALEGTILPFGGPKGSGLAIAVEMLAGGLADAAMGTDVTGTYHTEEPCTKGDLFLVVDPDALADGFVNRANAFLTDLKCNEPAPGSEAVRIPGERSIERDRTVSTIKVDPDRWAEIQTLAER